VFIDSEAGDEKIFFCSDAARILLKHESSKQRKFAKFMHLCVLYGLTDWIDILMAGASCVCVCVVVV
jgi:hypothetical protein